MRSWMQDFISFNYKRRSVLISYIVVLFFAIFVYKGGFSNAPTEEVSAVLPEVTISSVQALASGKSYTAVGTVEAVSEARLQTESGGRVISVSAELGKTVRAGSVLATLENGNERAFLLQAEGAYEAALAGAKQGDSGLRGVEAGLTSAEDAAKSAVQSAYAAVNTILITTTGDFYANPLGPNLPGVRVTGNTDFLSSERIAFRTIMPNWQTALTEVTAASLPNLLTQSEQYVTRAAGLLDSLITITSNAKNTDVLLGQPLSSYSGALLAERSKLNGVIANLQGAQTGLTAAKEAVYRAEIGGTTSDLSVANAQVKIALGSLRAAQANYEKTLVRTPITGVVNALYLKVGEYVAPSAPAAIVANNKGLQVSTAVSLEDSERLTIGDTIRVGESATGTLAAIAGAIDPTTGKVAVKISINDTETIQNGETVVLTFSETAEQMTEEINLPLSAVKMTGSGPVVFTVTENKTLEAVPVVLGAVSGSAVKVLDGISQETQIVVDARGLKAGEEVTISTK